MGACNRNVQKPEDLAGRRAAILARRQAAAARLAVALRKSERLKAEAHFITMLEWVETVGSFNEIDWCITSSYL